MSVRTQAWHEASPGPAVAQTLTARCDAPVGEGVALAVWLTETVTAAVSSVARITAARDDARMKPPWSGGAGCPATGVLGGSIWFRPQPTRCGHCARRF